jgi:hypothetical protein
VRESEIDERVPSGDFLFHVPYRLRRNSNLYANFFLAKASCTVVDPFIIHIGGHWITGRRPDSLKRTNKISEYGLYITKTV